MAQLQNEMPGGMSKHPSEIDEVRDAENMVGQGGPAEEPQEDYDIETVEKVYRKLDLRIIPGL